MRPVKLHRPSPGTVLGLLALIVALAGNANALGTHVVVRKGDIAPGAVTARALAPGAVHPKALAKGAVTSRKLRKGAVTTPKLAAASVTARALAPNSVAATAIKTGAVGPAALAPDAVTASALAPGSVYGGALGPVSVHAVPLVDHDESADLSTWTTSDAVNVLCGPGERLLTGGVVFTDLGNNRLGIVRSLPITNGSANGFSGQVTTDSGGAARAEVQAVCLK